MKSGNVSIPYPFPCWIWHPEGVAKTALTLTQSFTLARNVLDVEFFAALTGAMVVELNGVRIGHMEEHPQNATMFMKLADFPKVLEAGEHLLKLHITCTAPMPIEPVNAYLSQRTVGCIAFLQGDGIWLQTDNSWEADGVEAGLVCRLGEEPYGDLENSLDWFVAGGYGDIITERITHLDLLSFANMQCENLEWKLALSGNQNTRIDFQRIERTERHLFYHLLKQSDWQKGRAFQKENDLSNSPRVLIDLKKEVNARFRVTNHGQESVAILWNGAESIYELEFYDGCITEWFVVPGGGSHVIQPQGMRFLQLFVLDGHLLEHTSIDHPLVDSGFNDESTRPFLLDIEFESVGAALEQIGTFQGDLPLLNDIYDVAAHTNKVCHQLGLWDGIKRDRLNWAYDFYLAAKTDYVLWDDLTILRRSIEELGKTPYGFWMNGISAYTFWWINNLWEYFLYTNDRQFIYTVKDDLLKHISWIEANMDHDTGFLKERHPTLIEWVPMEEEEAWISLHAILLLTRKNLNLLASYFPELGISVNWQTPAIAETEFLNASALIAPLLGITSGLVCDESAVKFLDAYKLKDPITPLSAFWLADCYSKFDKHEQAWQVISTVWGKMLSSDATTFWESIVLSPQSNYHDSQTTYTAYNSYRMSLCHSWASTPVQWISRYVLGVEPLEPGYEKISFNPHAVGGLSYCRGTISSSQGSIHVEWKLREDGTLDAKIETLLMASQRYDVG